MSSPSNTPFFGRAYQLSIAPATQPGTEIVISSDAFEPNALRFTFDINQLAFKAFWQAEIEIFNCDGQITSGPSAGQMLIADLITEGSIVTVKAGYQYDGLPQTIWQGPVFQTIWDRVEVVDFRITLRCLLNRVLTTQNFINTTIPALSTQFDQAQFIASHSVTPIPVNGTQLQLLPTRRLPRGKSYFGSPHEFLHDIADDNGFLSWFAGNGFNMADLNQPVGPLVATYAPATVLGSAPAKQPDGTTLSLIGTPQQTQFGINFKVLLDPRLQILSPLVQVGIQMQFIRQAAVQYPLPEGQLPPRPLVNQYTVVGVRHYGDSRGNNWYSEVTAFSKVDDVIALLAN
jgi:hypothetical protein